jgi:peptidoglycan hydrolase-like protein with peptidoglycan-binding domain
VPATASKEILVADAQRIAIARGEALKPDGLYGPKTAAAWARVATAKGLDPTFARLGPRTVSVDAATYKALASGAMDPKSMAKAQAKRMLSNFGGKLLSGADGSVYIP